MNIIAIMTNAITISGLKKQYQGGVEALKGIDLCVERGEFFGLLGPNGAGKSTTIGVICSLVNKSEGHVDILGYDLDKEPIKVRQKLGIVPQEFNFNIFESCINIILNQAGYYGVSRAVALKKADELLEKLGLMDKKYSPAGTLSGGLKRRLMIARALVHEPEILILDEPTAGVDISLRRSMWEFLEKLNKDGLTIVLTTHYLEEAEQLCKRIAIIDNGELIENKPTVELLSALKTETVILYCDTDRLPEIPGLDITNGEDNTVEVTLKKEQRISDVIARFGDCNISVNRIRNKANRLEEMFVNLVK